MSSIALRKTLSLCAAVVTVLAMPAYAEIDGNSFHSSAWRIHISAPAGWSLSDQSSYPSILLWMYRRDLPGKMLLSVERLRQKQTSLQYAQETSNALKVLGFRVGTPQLHAATGSYWIDADKASVYLRQALLVSGSVGYSLTLSAENPSIRKQHVRAFDSALRSIRIDRELPATPTSTPTTRNSKSN